MDANNTAKMIEFFDITQKTLSQITQALKILMNTTEAQQAEIRKLKERIEQLENNP